MVKQKIETILKRIEELKPSGDRCDPEASLTFLCYCLLALAHWRTWGYTRVARVNDVMDLIKSELEAMEPGEAKATIEKDLQGTLASIFFKAGDFHQSIVNEYSFPTQSSPLNRGLYYLSIGDVDGCLNCVGDDIRAQAVILKLKCCRLLGEYSEFDQILKRHVQYQGEMAWEKVLREVATDRKMLPLVFRSLADEGMEFSTQGSYVLEGFLMKGCFRAAKDVFFKNKLMTIVRKANIQYQNEFKPLWQYALFCDDRIDSPVSRASLVEAIGAVLATLSFCPVDKKLLFLAHAAHFSLEKGIKDFKIRLH